MPTSTILSAVGVCNLALVQIKQGPIVGLESPSTPAERNCALVYDHQRRVVLRGHPWNFAIKRVSISPDGTVPAFGFSHRYRLPSNFVRYVSRHDQLGRRLHSSAEQYQLEDGFILLNGEDASDIFIRYIYDHRTIAGWDALAIELLALNIAITLAPSYNVVGSRLVALREKHLEVTAEARAIDGQERPPVRIERSKFLDARRRLGSNTVGRFTEFSG